MFLRLVLFLMALSFAASVQAQQPDPLKDLFFPPDLILSNQSAIGLTDAQRRAILDEVAELQNRIQESQRQLSEAAQSLLAALRQTPVDEKQALTMFDKVLASEAAGKRAQVGLMIRIKNKLSAEQQAQLQALRAK